MSLLITILIVYGATLIWVQGSIFFELKDNLLFKINKFKNFFIINEEEIEKLNEDELDEKSKKYFNTRKDSFSLLLTTNPDNKNFEEVSRLFKLSTEKLKQSIEISRKNKYYSRYLLFKIYEKFYKLWTCMMCSSFWIGCLLTMFYIFSGITLFGIPFDSVVNSSILIYKLIGIICIGFLTSGTTWAINSIVDLLDDLKSKINRS
jgi:hypothetical protein